MISAILVDDEILTVKALRKIIESNSLNVNIAAEAYDGIEALNIVEKIKPDFAIVDIKMPRMDGIEFMRKIQELKIDTKVIVLSAYRDFEFASKAMQYGAYGYLVKPVDKNKLLEMIAKVEEIIESDKQIVQLKNKISESLPFIKEKFIRQILAGTLKYSNIREDDRILLDINKNDCQLMMISSQVYPHTIQNDEKQIIEALELLIKSKTKGIAFFNKPDEIIVIFNRIDYTGSIKSDESFSLALDIKRLLNEFNYIDITLSLSSINFTIDEMDKAYREAKIAQIYKFYMGLDSVIAFENIKHIQFMNNQKFINSEEYFIEQIKMGDIDGATQTYSEIFENLQKNMNMNPETVYNACYEIVLTLKRILKDSNGEEDLKVQLGMLEMDDLKSYHTLKELFEFMKQIIGRIVLSIDKNRKSEDTKIVEKTKQYCEVNFSKDITLESISNHVNMTKNYFCTFFRKKTGENFWDYLTNLRINKAKELLETTDIKIGIIAEKVGYKNLSHFSRIFKNALGVSPAEYKEKIG